MNLEDIQNVLILIEIQLILQLVHLKYSFGDQVFPYIVLTSIKMILIDRN